MDEEELEVAGKSFGPNREGKVNYFRGREGVASVFAPGGPKEGLEKEGQVDEDK